MVIFEEYGMKLFVPLEEVQDFQELMTMESDDPTGIIWTSIVKRFDEMAVYKRQIQQRIAEAFNRCDSLATQLIFLEDFPEIKVSKGKVSFIDSDVKLNDLWVN